MFKKAVDRLHFLDAMPMDLTGYITCPYRISSFSSDEFEVDYQS
jgi:hypothetical protein